MKFLDLNGLTHFFGKVKTWAGNNYLSLKGGTINGNINISGNVSALQFKKTNGTSTQVLIADGSVKGIGSANGVAGLDSKGYVPLSQLGNLDTTVAEVVSALPTTNIKKHIYLVKDTDGVTQNQYEEYLYTGDTSAEYDDSKWEKLGNFHPTVDLANYAKKPDTVKNISFYTYGSTNMKLLKIVKADDTIDYVTIPMTNTDGYGFMAESDKRKLDGIANNANNYSLPTASSTTKGGITLGYSQSGKNYPVVLDSNGKAYVNVPWTDTNTTYSLATPTNDGLMKASDKAKIDSIDTTYAKKNEAMYSLGSILHNKEDVHISFDDINGDELAAFEIKPATGSTAGVMAPSDKVKLNGIASGATADSAITTAEIDALFV